MKSFKELREGLEKACWKGYEAIGTKKKNGKEVPNCVPVKEELDEASMGTLMAANKIRQDKERLSKSTPRKVDNSKAQARDAAWWKAQDDAHKAGKDTFEFDGKTHPLKGKSVNEDWQKINRQDKTDGLSQKAVNAYRRENPGSKLQTAVTEKDPSGKRVARRKSFCARMSGMKRAHASAETKRDPDSPINKALRRWRC